MRYWDTRLRRAAESGSAGSTDVLVTDSSVLIGLSKVGLLDRMFELEELRFAVPDTLFREELIDLGRYSRRDLLDLGLEVESLDPEGMRLAYAYGGMRRSLSVVDSHALAGRRGWKLLTEDRVVSNVARSEGIAVRGIQWVIDEMAAAGIVPKA